MHFYKIIKTVIFLLALQVTTQAFAFNCGDVITHDISLTHDLHCNSGEAAFYVFTDGVTVDLNGHILSGSSSLSGIYFSGHDNVTVKNGVIKGFFAGVNANRADDASVDRITFYNTGSGVTSNASNRLRITNNKFIFTQTAVSLRNSDKSTSSNKHQIINNEIYDVDTGIELCGGNSASSVVSDNLISQARSFGISLSSSDKNRITNNRILDSKGNGIRLNRSSFNSVTGNSILRSSLNSGISIIYDEPSSACLDNNPDQAIENVISYNHSIGFGSGVLLGLSSSSLRAARVRNNHITQNKLYDNIHGIIFSEDSKDNSASRNGLLGTSIEVLDNGTDNRY